MKKILVTIAVLAVVAYCFIDTNGGSTNWEDWTIAWKF